MSRAIVSTCLTFALIAGVGAVTAKVVRSELISEDTLRDATDTKTVRHEFTEKPDEIRFSVDCSWKKGSFAWKLIDPEGAVVARGRTDGKATTDIDESYPGQAGEWSIEMEYEEARGRYAFHLSAGTD